MQLSQILFYLRWTLSIEMWIAKLIFGVMTEFQTSYKSSETRLKLRITIHDTSSALT